MKKQEPPSKQHYLPCVYLKQFSPLGVAACRESPIWSSSRHGPKRLPVESQCFERYFYSARNGEETESLFKTYEDLYGVILKRIWQGKSNENMRQYFGLMFFIVSLHLRNPAYNVCGSLGSRIDGYKLLEYQFIHHHLMGNPTHRCAPEQQIEQLKNSWGVRVFTSASKDNLITSDNPALWYSLGDSGNVAFMILPLTPNSCALAYNLEAVSLSGDSITQADAVELNRAQIRSSLKALYSDAPFSDEDVQESEEFWKIHRPPSGFINQHECEFNLIAYRENLSFVTGRSCS